MWLEKIKTPAMNLSDSVLWKYECVGWFLTYTMLNCIKSINKWTHCNTLFCEHPVFSFLQEYVLECRRYSGSKENERFWIINKRFNDFVALDSGLHQSGYQGSSLNLPKKKIVGNMGKKLLSPHFLKFSYR